MTTKKPYSKFSPGGYTLEIILLRNFGDYLILEKEFHDGTYEVIANKPDIHGIVYNKYTAIFLIPPNGHLVAASGNTVEEVLRLCLGQHTASLWDKCLDVSIDRKIAKACSQAAI